MKRFACCIISILILLSLVGCARVNTIQESSEKHYDIISAEIPSSVTPTPSPNKESNNEVTTEEPTPIPTPNVFDVDNVDMQATPQSSCFSEIGYDSEWEILVVRFRNSSSTYTYSDFPEGEWSKFVSADSLGRWFNKHIKGQYEYERIS